MTTDALGDAYEYLIGKFADVTKRKKAGEFYTRRSGWRRPRPTALLGRRPLGQREPFLARGGRQPLIERHDLER